MSALIYVLTSDIVRLATDTLMVDAVTRQPRDFRSKSCVLPASSVIVGGTGLASLIEAWFAHLRGLPPMDIHQLNLITPDNLSSATAASGGLNGIESTLYHFGHSLQADGYIGFAYRSTHDFRSEAIPNDSLGIKPPITIDAADVLADTFLVEAMQRLQTRDRALPILKQIGIGGEVEVVDMRDGGIQQRTLNRFLNYDQDAEAMLRQRK